MSALASQPHHNLVGRHAIVMGGSMAGLLAARVLSDHFDTVTLLERDRFPAGDTSRKGVPQGEQPHALLAKGYEILSRLFPDLPDALHNGGAVFLETGTDMRWFHAGDYRIRSFIGLTGPFMSRPFLERLVRERVLALPNVYALTACDVRGLTVSRDGTCITGVRMRRPEAEDEEMLSADLIVDATGRGSRSPAWLEELGYPRPEEETIRINMGYTTLIYKREPADITDAKAVYVTPSAPQEKRYGAVFPIEGDRWLVCMGGWLGDHAPTDHAGFLEFARNLPVPDVYDIIAHKEPISEFRTFKYPYNLRRRYEKLPRFPEGYLVLGDALCSFNPVYGQGMTSAALTAEVLEKCLQARTSYGDLRGLAKAFFPEAAKRVDTPWRMAAGADFQYPEAEGIKAPGTDLLNAYFQRMHRATHSDPVVYAAFSRVMHLLASPFSLLTPGMIWRVFRAAWSKPRPRPERAASPSGGKRVVWEDGRA
jgi:2-polyprenyl-6-methoxyphenol hydroxylase-like FAD-dependent oxidoreductase